MTVKSFALLCLDEYYIKTPQARRRSPFPYVPDAAPSRNLANPVVAVAEVLGPKTVDVLVT